MPSPKKSGDRNPRVHVTLSEGHYRKLLNYCKAYNLAPAQACAHILQTQIDIIHERENLPLNTYAATKVYYDVIFGKAKREDVDFEKVAQEQNLPLEEVEARFEEALRIQNPFPKRRKHDKSECKDKEDCECAN